MLIISLSIKFTSEGPVLFKQNRVTNYGRIFKILKFRTMVVDAEKQGIALTQKHDKRITGVGRFLRKLRLDELPQLFNILLGQMSFVGTRPEVPAYVAQYTDKMKATLLMPAGVTSLASIKFKDEDKILMSSENIENTYINEVLPQKMKYNLEYIEKFNLFYDVKIMFRTFFAVIKRD
jgi:lipopolysaccharide/colanic/teichoic acid biosynthesis glycosyltransferase